MANVLNVHMNMKQGISLPLSRAIYFPERTEYASFKILLCYSLCILSALLPNVSLGFGNRDLIKPKSSRKLESLRAGEQTKVFFEEKERSKEIVKEYHTELPSNVVGGRKKSRYQWMKCCNEGYTQLNTVVGAVERLNILM